MYEVLRCENYPESEYRQMIFDTFDDAKKAILRHLERKKNKRESERITYRDSEVVR